MTDIQTDDVEDANAVKVGGRSDDDREVDIQTGGLAVEVDRDKPAPEDEPDPA